MGELRIRLQDATGAALPGHRVTLGFQLRLAGVGAEMLMPAEAVGVTDLEGGTTLNLPSPEGLGDTLRVLVRDGSGRLVHEAELARAGVGGELRVTVGAPAAPTTLVVDLLAAGQPLAGVEVALLGRAEGASSFGLLIAGRTDASGRIQGPYPAAPLAEASAMVRANGNQTLPVALEEGKLPARVVLSVVVEGVSAAAPPAVAPAPAATHLPVPVAAPEEASDDEETGARSRRRRSRVSTLSAGLPGQVVLGLLALIVLLGAALRFYELGGPSLWNDELSSWRRASYDTVAKVITKGTIDDVHPPGYYLLLHFVQKVGDSEWMLRLPSAIAGVASLVVIFLLGRRLWSDKEGLIAAGLMAVLWAPIHYSQETRAYSLLVLFSMLSVMAWMSVMREVDHKGRVDLEGALWYVLTATVLNYLHYFGVVLVGLQAMAAFGYAGSRRHRRGGLAPLAGVYLAVALLYLPWIKYFFEDLTQSESWMDDPGEGGQSALWAYLKFLFNHKGWVTTYMVGLVAAAAAWQLQQARSGGRLSFSLRSRWGLVACWFAAPFALAWLQSVLSTPVLSNRNLLIAAPAVYLLVARAVTALPLPGRLQAALAALTIAIAGAGFAAKSYYSKPTRQQYREVVQYVVDHEDEAPGAAIVVTGHPMHFNYYLERLGASRRSDISANSESDVEKVKRLFAEEKPDAIWRLRTGRYDDSPVDAFLSERMKIVDEAEFKGTSVTLYARGGRRAEDGAEESVAPAEAEGSEAEAKPKNKKKKAKAEGEEAPATEEEQGAEKPKDAKKGKKKAGKAEKAAKASADTGR